MVAAGANVTMNQGQELIWQALTPAAAAVSQMLGIPLQLVPGSGAGGCPARRGGDILTSLTFSGDWAGELVMHLSPQTGLRLASRLLGSEQELPLNQRAASALLELGNVLASAFVTELDNRFALVCRLHPPRLIADFPSAGPAPVHFQLRGSQGEIDIRMEIFLSAEDRDLTFRKS